ncbi:hypothetical protein PSH84_16665 [Pseudomonas beijingensis]|uniref:hypothetical protein n=1 Tax=Pseudomonas beijingensis TaxID=2954101 RepID=UPI002732A77B|nr:hypothetical protein [Pseudomonas sp. FP830]WLI48157.1 hypothetical protein PSH84_16665 [Pseudomonas sp. FP830]
MLIAARPASSATTLPVNGWVEAWGWVLAIANEVWASIHPLSGVCLAGKDVDAKCRNGGSRPRRSDGGFLHDGRNIFINMMIVISCVKLNIWRVQAGIHLPPKKQAALNERGVGSTEYTGLLSDRPTQRQHGVPLQVVRHRCYSPVFPGERASCGSWYWL